MNCIILIASVLIGVSSANQMNDMCAQAGALAATPGAASIMALIPDATNCGGSGCTCRSVRYSRIFLIG